jgi:hypothetical protein
MNWFAVSLPKSVRSSPVKVEAKKFSPEQTLVALLRWFAAQPLQEQVNLLDAYRAQKREREAAEAGPTLS